jgi:hypothetical protein
LTKIHLSSKGFIKNWNQSLFLASVWLQMINVKRQLWFNLTKSNVLDISSFKDKILSFNFVLYHFGSFIKIFLFYEQYRTCFLFCSSCTAVKNIFWNAKKTGINYWNKKTKWNKNLTKYFVNSCRNLFCPPRTFLINLACLIILVILLKYF